MDAISSLDRVEQLLFVAVKPHQGFQGPSAQMIFAAPGQAAMYEWLDVVHLRDDVRYAITYAFTFSGEKGEQVTYLSYDSDGKILAGPEVFTVKNTHEIGCVYLRILLENQINVITSSMSPIMEVHSEGLLALVRSELTERALPGHPHRVRIEFNYGETAISLPAKLNYRIVIERPLGADPLQTEATMTVDLFDDRTVLSLIHSSGIVMREVICMTSEFESMLVWLQIEIASAGIRQVAYEFTDSID
ncbi:hypothetical protein HGA91_05590 [candidate division WWE3 bacterium]|nr:hypothetical protein [candidate division WWE3 bacterium]